MLCRHSLFHARWHILATFTLAVLVLIGQASAKPSVNTFERWYAVMLKDQHIGWSHAVVKQTHPDTITTTTHMQLTIRRGPNTVRMVLASTFVETSDGKPIEAYSDQTLGQLKLTYMMKFGPQSVEYITRQGNVEQRRTLPYPKIPLSSANTSTGNQWLTPEAAQRFIEQQITAQAKKIHYWSLDPSMGTDPVEIHMDVHGHEDVEVMGKVVPAILCQTTVSKLPGVATREYLDEQGRGIKSTLSLIPGMTLTIVEADKQLATLEVDPPELLASSLIKPDKSIHKPRELRSAIYELTLTDTDEQSENILDHLPPTSIQRVEPRGQGTTRVTVDLDHLIIPPGQDIPDASHLDPSAMLNGQDPKVQQLLKQALSGQAHNTPAQKAEAIRRFVYQYIEAKDLSVGLATASEVARTGQGDCTEHAVLLAAMLRAANIPSRTVSGIIYVDQFINKTGVFGYHMWTQGWINDQPAGQSRWVDLDATLEGQPFDAAHIALATSVMSDTSMVNDLINMVPIIGRLNIKVINTVSLK